MQETFNAGNDASSLSRNDLGPIEDLAHLAELLSGLVGPSGAEDAVIKVVRERLQAIGLRPEVDPLGNVIVRVPSAGTGKPTVMVSAHMDEVGFVIRKIEQDGFIRVSPVGGVHDRVLPGQRLLFIGSAGLVEGAVGLKAKHLTTPEELGKSIPVDEIYVDVLASSMQEVQALGLEVGSLGVYAPGFARRGELIRGKALDDRLGVAVLLRLAEELAKDPPECGVVLVASVHEEFNVRGVVTAARHMDPDLAICVDIAVASDTPDPGDPSPVYLGRGPVVTAYTRGASAGLIPSPKLRQAMLETAANCGIAIQHAILRGGLSEGAFIQYEGRGIPTLDVGFPVRYTHTPVETANLRDVADVTVLLLTFLRSTAPRLKLQRGV